MAAVTATATSTNVLTLGFAFGPSRRTRSPPVLRPLLTSARRAAASRPPPSPPTRRTPTMDGHPGTPTQTSPDKNGNLPRTPAASTQPPLDDHRLCHAL